MKNIIESTNDSNIIFVAIGSRDFPRAEGKSCVEQDARACSTDGTQKIDKPASERIIIT